MIKINQQLLFVIRHIMWVLIVGLLLLAGAGGAPVCPSPPNPTCQESVELDNGDCVVQELTQACRELPSGFWLNATYMETVVRNPMNEERWIMFMCAYGHEKSQLQCRQMVDSLIALKAPFHRMDRNWNIGFLDCTYFPDQ